jgi:hypothetical protein
MKSRRFRSSPIRVQREELLPDVTRRLGRPIKYSSGADRAAMERLFAKLATGTRMAA